MVRELVSHRVNGLNDVLKIEVLDEPGPGNACHEYEVSIPAQGMADGEVSIARIQFQKGPILEEGVNGISNEALLAIVEDRLLGFQSGQFACRENAIAMTKIQEAMMWLQKRTLDRLRRGVEGTSKK